MARTRKPTSLIASAVQLPVVRQGFVSINGPQGWQDEGSRLYDELGELRFVANWVGQVMSRAELIVMERTNDGDKEVNGGPVRQALDDYFGGTQGQQEMQRQTGLHLTVPGELYHVYYAKDDRWAVLAYDSVKQQQNKVMADFGDGEGWVELVKGRDLVIRLWQPHPFDPIEADSPTRSNIPTLQEIERANQHIQAVLESRLAGAGVFFVPNEITFPKPEDADPSLSNADVFMDVLGKAMITPIQNPGSASAYVPIVAMVPGEYLGDIKHQTFWTELSDNIVPLRDAAIKRFALGMDVPPEVLTGMAATNHWNAWLVDEASVKAHTEPRLQVITNAITTAYLWPALQGVVPDPNKFYVAADTSQIRLRPNRSSEAIELHDRGVLNEAALRRETGFDPQDAPTEDERRENLLRKIALAASSPEQAAEAARQLGVELTPTGQRQEQPDNLGPPARIETPEQRREPDMRRSEDARAAALLSACDALVFRALERAGNRLKSQHNYTGKAPAFEVYLEVSANTKTLDLLFSDCWGVLPRVIGPLTDNIAEVQAALDGYCRYLVREQMPHTTDLLRSQLALVRV